MALGDAARQLTSGGGCTNDNLISRIYCTFAGHWRRLAYRNKSAVSECETETLVLAIDIEGFPTHATIGAG